MNNLLHDYLIERDGASRGGRVLATGAELKRLADAADLTVRHLYQIALGSKRASWRAASIIEHETGGKVSAASVMPTYGFRGKGSGLKRQGVIMK